MSATWPNNFNNQNWLENPKREGPYMERAACGRFKQTAGVAYICQLCINYDVCVSGERGVRCAGKGKRGRLVSRGRGGKTICRTCDQKLAART